MAERKGRMNDRERVEAMLKHEKPDRVPIWPFAAAGFCCVHTKTSIADAYNKPEVSYAAQKKTAQDFGWVFAPRIGYAAYGAWEFGGEVKWPSGQFAQAPSVVRHPVETEEDAWNLKLPDDISQAGIVPLQTQFFQMSSKELLDNEPFNKFAYCLGPFNTAAMVCSTDRLAKWLIKKPDVAHHILRLTTDYMLKLLEYWKGQFGLENNIVLSGEAVGTGQIISAEQFEVFVLPYFQEVYKKAFSLGFKHIYCHLCGEQNANLVHWAKLSFGETGIISIGHEVELETAGSYFPNDIILGNLEPAIIQSQTPEEVYQATKKNLEDGITKCPGGYIFSPGCELPPMAPEENVMAMTRAVNDFGWYD